MKKLVLAIMIAALVCSMFAYTQQAIPKEEVKMEKIEHKVRSIDRDPPAYSFITEPIDIQTSYYDYMPGSYISNPLRVQYDETTAGANGLYMVFHSTETASAERRCYICYINADGTLNSVNYLNQEDIKEGYVSMDIDLETMDPLAIWHIDLDDDTIYEDAFGYDSWHLLNSPGLISTPFDLIDNNDWSGYDFEPPYEDDEFIWPYVWVVKGPNYDQDQSRRIYVWASNYTSHMTDPSENMVLGYADFTTSDLSSSTISSLDWQFQTFPLLDYYNADNDVWGRYNKGIACNDEGQIAMIGYLSADDLEHEGSDMVVFYNDTWAEGDWDVVQVDAHSVVDMPLNQDGSDYFEVDAGEEIFFDWTNSSHPEAMFDSQGKLHFVGNYVLGHENSDGEHMLWAYFSYVKEVTFDPASMTLKFSDLYPQSTSEDATFPYLPWDEDQNGEIDEYSEEGNVMSNLGWPIWWYGWDEAFHENTFKLAKNEDMNWLVAVWHDGINSRLYNDGGDEDYVDWANVPEIAISLSADNGLHWAEPIFMNAIDTPELEGMIPTYVYPAGIVENVGDNHGLLHLMFFDDNSFGSFIQGQGSNDGGMLRYMSIDIDFSGLPVLNGTNESSAPEVVDFNLTNYPNPFNPTTNISFDLPAKSNVKLSVYNIKGQLVKTIVDRKLDQGPQAFTWKGDNNANQTVSSGIYFYKLEAGNKTETKKMLMLK